MERARANTIVIILGVVAILIHARQSFFILLGTGLASTPETRVPASAETLWGIALYGTFVAAVLLFVVLRFWTMKVFWLYALVWTVLAGCFLAGDIINAGWETRAYGYRFLELATVTTVLLGTGGAIASTQEP